MKGITSLEQRPEPSEPRPMITDWSASGDLFAAVLAGLLIGWGADRLFGTDPLFVVLGGVAGFVVGFWKMFLYSDHILEQIPRSRTLPRDGFGDDA